MTNERTPLTQIPNVRKTLADREDELSLGSIDQVNNEEESEEEEVPTADSKTANNDPDLRDVLSRTKLMGSTRLFDTYNEEHDARERVSAATATATLTRRPSWALESRLAQSGRIAVEQVQSGFLNDARNLAEGSVPQSIVLSLAIGTLCGVVCYLYYSMLNFLLDFIWHGIPEKLIEGKWDERFYVLWIPIVTLSLAVCVGLSVRILGEPGDLPFTIRQVHERAYIPMDHVIPMVCASLFSILAGGSLGPEAPLVAICGALGGWVSRTLFRQTARNVVRKHTLMGMAGALAAFFGVPLGGSLFALEVNSRFGVEYFEHLVEAIFCGEICLVVFRSLSGLAIKPIWTITSTRMTEAMPRTVIVGGLIGLLGAGMASLFAIFHWAVLGAFQRLGLLNNENAIQRALTGASAIALLGMLVPHTMFWGEEEFQAIVSMSPASTLPNVWPTSGLLNFELDSPITALVLGVTKLIAISFTVSGGLRGGYIFPFFATGAALGRVVHWAFPQIPVQICCLCFAAGINVAITRTALASTLILAFLSGEPCTIPATLCASLCSLFATFYFPFIKTQIARSDIDQSLFHKRRKVHTRDGSTITVV